MWSAVLSSLLASSTFAPASSACSFADGCPWDKLAFKCGTDGRDVLAVVYTQITHYSGAVSCGNLFLEKDIGNGINTAPYVVYPQAETSKFYALVMIDPDADLPNNGSFPEASTVGVHAPVRHWVVGNIAGADILHGDLSKATTVSPFVGPSPPWGSHRYGQFLFEQKTGNIDFATFPPSASILIWDYAAFIANYSLGEPVASNWHVTMHTE